MEQLKTILAALLLLCSTVATAHDFEVDGIYYNIQSQEEKTVEVTYEGDRPYGNYWGNVRIPASVTYKGTTYSVTTIGNYAFSDCSSLTSVVIPNSVTTIGEEAFVYCSSLASIEIPNSVTTIGTWAFNGCSSLTSIEIPNSVRTIGYSAFGDCSSLTSIEIPNSVTTIEAGVFIGCYGLTNITVDENNLAYDSRNNCNAIIETASNTLVSGCQSTIIPNSVTTIGVEAFEYCSSLTSRLVLSTT